MLRGFPASPARVFTCSQHVRAFTLSHLKHVTCSRYAPSCSRPCASASHCSAPAAAFVTTLRNTLSLVRLLLPMLFLHGSLGPNTGCFFMGPGLPIPGCFPFFTSIWHMFHPPHPMISMSTSPSESRLPIHPWNQLSSDVTGFRNTQASRENRNHHLQEHIPASHHHLPRTTRNVHHSVDVLICGTSTALMTSGYHAATCII